MEKINLGIRLVLLPLIIIGFSCGGKKAESTTEQSADTVIIDVDTVGIPEYGEEPAYAAEIFEYRSETLKNYQLYAVYPFQDAPQFLMVRNDEARLLAFNEDEEVEEGQALDDEEFASAKFLQELETEGIITFGQIELTTRADLHAEFNQSQTKRALTIGSTYGYSGEIGSGDLSLQQTADGYKFSVSLSAGDHICELQGNMRVKGNIGYFQGEPYDTTCKLIFLFTNDSVEILSVTSNSACGCGANASLNHTFTKR